MNTLEHMRLTTDVAMLASFVGLFLPYLVAFINQPTWSPLARGLMTQVIYGITGVVVAWFAGDLSEVDDIVSAIVPIFLVASTKYHFLDKPSNIAPRIEYATSNRDFGLYAEDRLAQPPKPVVIDTPVGTSVYKPET